MSLDECKNCVYLDKRAYFYECDSPKYPTVFPQFKGHCPHFVNKENKNNEKK